jgi:hypothetical protein
LVVLVTDASLLKLRTEVNSATARNAVSHFLVLDNVQQYQTVREQGLNRVSKLKVGTAATAVPPGPFDPKDHLE